MSKYNVIITVEAQRELDEIVQYIAYTLKNPKAADDFLDDLEKCISNMELHPRFYPLSSDTRLAEQGYRKAAIKNYVMLYKINTGEKQAVIQGIFYCRQDYVKLL
jgi:plasmid stabilization system protein ParE